MGLLLSFDACHLLYGGGINTLLRKTGLEICLYLVSITLSRLTRPLTLFLHDSANISALRGAIMTQQYTKFDTGICQG